MATTGRDEDIQVQLSLTDGLAFKFAQQQVLGDDSADAQTLLELEAAALSKHRKTRNMRVHSPQHQGQEHHRHHHHHQQQQHKAFNSSNNSSDAYGNLKRERSNLFVETKEGEDEPTCVRQWKSPRPKHMASPGKCKPETEPNKLEPLEVHLCIDVDRQFELVGEDKDTLCQIGKGILAESLQVANANACLPCSQEELSEHLIILERDIVNSCEDTAENNRRLFREMYVRSIAVIAELLQSEIIFLQVHHNDLSSVRLTTTMLIESIKQSTTKNIGGGEEEQAWEKVASVCAGGDMQFAF